ncbi:MAG: hypothetical protein F6J87_14845 [Spirulina sp. SIO3F2]|nr:hypothetical protein [Spirulina sp. SIO3F2]
MTSLIFPVYAKNFFSGNRSIRNGSYSIIPYIGASAPSKSAQTLNDITDLVPGNNSNYIFATLQNPGSDSYSRIVRDPGVDIEIQFAPVSLGVIDQGVSPITGFVIADSTNPSSSSMPCFYMQRVNDSSIPEAFVPNGVELLSVNLTTTPVHRIALGGTMSDDYLYYLLRSERSPSFRTFYIVFFEGLTNIDSTWSTYGDLMNLATKPNGSQMAFKAVDVGGNSSNRFQVGANSAYMQFDPLLLAAFATQTNAAITHYGFVEDSNSNPPLSSSDYFMGGNALSAPYTPDGSDRQIILSSVLNF